MAHPHNHAVSSAKLFGGKPEDYLPIHHWFDATKAYHADWRHRALRHHTLGIFEAEEKFGVVIVNSDGKEVPVRLIGEQHVREDLGFIPTPSDWLNHMSMESWMNHMNEKINQRIRRGGDGIPMSLEEALKNGS